MITEAIHKAISGKDLEYDTARAAMEEIMEGKATQAQIASFPYCSEDERGEHGRDHRLRIRHEG